MRDQQKIKQFIMIQNLIDNRKTMSMLRKLQMNKLIWNDILHILKHTTR